MVDMASISVVVIDPVSVTRELLVAVLEAASGILVLAAGADGEAALRLVRQLQPTVVVMDVCLPKLDGVEVIRRIMRETPTRIVVIGHDHMPAETDRSFEALQAGALTVVRKPVSLGDDACGELIKSVQLMADVPVVHHWGRRSHLSAEALLEGAHTNTAEMRRIMRAATGIQILGIAASTGGPKALGIVLGALPAEFPLPILVVQHVAKGFAAGLVQWLATRTSLSVALAAHGERPEPGKVLVAPDDVHLRVGARRDVELSHEPPYKGLRPSANPLFLSLANVYGPAAMGIILTGMGDDGADGLAALHRAGGPVIAQDESTSVIYGMPQAAVSRGIVDDVLALPLIASALAAWHTPEKVGAQ